MKYRPGNGQMAGIPDLYVAHPRFHGWIEVKWERGKLRPLQRHRITELHSVNVPVLVVRGPGGEIEDAEGRVLALLEWDGDIPRQLQKAHKLWTG